MKPTPLRFLQIARVEPFSEAPVDRSQQFTRLLHFALVAPEACEARGGAEFPTTCACPLALAARLVVLTVDAAGRYLQFEVAGPTGKGGRGGAPLTWPTWRWGLAVMTWGVGEA